MSASLPGLSSPGEVGEDPSGGGRLRSSRFVAHPRIEAAFRNAPPIFRGETGEAVARVQQTLVEDGFPMPGSTMSNGELDGIFGSETFGTVWRFQDRYGLDTDGVVGHDTLQQLDVTAEQKDEDQEPESATATCEDINKFGKNFASAVNIVVSSHIPSARPRDGSPGEIMFSTGGVRNASVFEINANATLDPFEVGDALRFQHGVIQTTRTMSFAAAYSGGKKASRSSIDSRDAEPRANTPPWVRNPPADGGPVPLLPGGGAGKGFRLADKPQHFFPWAHPKESTAGLERISFKTVFDFWHIVKETASDGTVEANLAFLSNFQITLESKAEKSQVNDTFIGSRPNYRITRPIACGKGSASPVLDTPITLEALAKLKDS